MPRRPAAVPGRPSGVPIPPGTNEPAAPRGWARALVDRLFGYDFFISYAWIDGRPYARALAAALRDRGFDCFLDSETYYPGDHWQRIGAWALRRTTRLVLIGTAGALESKAVLREVEVYTALGRRIVPIALDGSLDALPPEHPLATALAAEVLRVRDPLGLPSSQPAPATVDDVVRTFRGERQVAKRLRWTRNIALLLVLLLLTAVGLALAFVEQRDRAVDAARRADRGVARLSATLAGLARGTSYAPVRASQLRAAHLLFQSAAAAGRAGDLDASHGATLAALAASGRLEHTVGHTGALLGAAYDVTGAYLLTWSEDGEVRLSRAATGARVQSRRLPASPRGARFSPDGTLLLTYTLDEAAVWRVPSLEPLGASITPGERINTASWIPGSSAVAVVGVDRAGAIWEPASRRIRTVRHPAQLRGMEVSRALDLALTWGGDRVEVFHLSTGATHTIACAADADGAVALPDFSRAAISGFMKPGVLVDPRSGRCVATLDDAQGGAVFAGVSPGGDAFLVRQPLGVFVHRWSDGRLLRPPMVLQPAIAGARFSPDGRRVMGWSTGGALQIAAVTATAADVDLDLGEWADEALFLPGDRVLTLGTFDARARIWRDGQEVEDPIQGDGRPLGVAVSPDGQHVLLHAARVARSYRASSSTFLAAEVAVPGPVFGVVQAPGVRGFAAWTATGTIAVVGAGAPRTFSVGRDCDGLVAHPTLPLALAWSYQGEAALVDLTGATAPQTPFGAAWSASGGAFSSDGRRLAVFGGDRLEVWTLHPLARERVAEASGPVRGVAFGADARAVLYWSDDTSRMLAMGSPPMFARSFASDVHTLVLDPPTDVRRDPAAGRLMGVEPWGNRAWLYSTRQGLYEVGVGVAPLRIDGITEEISEASVNAARTQVVFSTESGRFGAMDLRSRALEWFDVPDDAFPGGLAALGDQRWGAWGSSGSVRLIDLRATPRHAVSLLLESMPSGVMPLDRRGSVLTWTAGPTARMWDAVDGRVIGDLRQPDEITAVCTDPDRREAVTGGRDGVLRLWRLPDIGTPTVAATLAAELRARSWSRLDPLLELEIAEPSPPPLGSPASAEPGAP